MKAKYLALALAALVPAGLALAEPGDENVGQVVYTHEPLPVATPVARVAQPVTSQLTEPQKRALAQGKAVRPGFYRFRSLHSGMCGASAHVLSTPPLVTLNCTTHPGLASFAVLPHPAGGYTIRSHPSRYGYDGERLNSASELGNCLTVARNVLIGAPRIELRPCDVTGTDWTRAGADDQRFFISKVGSDTFQVMLAEVGDGADCWVLREGGRNEGTEVIRWQCARTPDQLWQLQWIEPLNTSLEAGLLAATEWYRTSSGHFNIRAVPGIDLTGPTYSSFDTANDSGDYCRKRCAELDQCKAWTWTGPGYVTNSNDPPKCYWKSAAGEAINRGPQTFGKLRSGIVRP